MVVFANKGYFEAVLQLRPENEQVLRFVKKQLKNSKTKISKEVKSKHGIDLYLSSQRFAISLSRRLKKSFKKGEVKISRSLFTTNRQTSKRVYRVTVLFRLKEEE